MKEFIEIKYDMGIITISRGTGAMYSTPRRVKRYNTGMMSWASLQRLRVWMAYYYSCYTTDHIMHYMKD